ncbi:permease-like cell division protein FtsX [Actinomycetes bacterium KLBMP 9797]
MNQLRTLFDRALSDEPPPSREDVAREAITSGRRLRHRRRLVMGGGAAAVAAVATTIIVALSPAPTVPPAQRTPISLAMAVACAEVRFATDSAAIFLRPDVTDQQRDALHKRLRSDHRIREVRYVSRAAAYAQFARMYRDSPDLVHAVRVEQVPESFHVRLAMPAGDAAFVDEVEGWPGVEAVSGAGCPEPTRDTE